MTRNLLLTLWAVLVLATGCSGSFSRDLDTIEASPCGSKKNSECRQAAALEGILDQLGSCPDCPPCDPVDCPPCPPGDDCPPCPPPPPCPPVPACDSCCPDCPPGDDDGPLPADEEEAIAAVFECEAVAIRRESGGWSVDWRDQDNNGFNQNKIVGCKGPGTNGLWPDLVNAVDNWFDDCTIAQQTRRGC